MPLGMMRPCPRSSGLTKRMCRRLRCPLGGRLGRLLLTIGVTNVISLLNYRVSLFLVERFHGLSAAGTYSVAVTVAELLWLLSSSVTVSAYARIGHPDVRVASAMTVQAVRINVLATLVAAPILLAGAWWALPWVMGRRTRLHCGLWRPCCPVAAYAAASSLSAFYTNHLGKPHLSGAIAGLSLLTSLLAGLVLVPRWGPTGAALASSSGYFWPLRGLCRVPASCQLAFTRPVDAGTDPRSGTIAFTMSILLQRLKHPVVRLLSVFTGPRIVYGWQNTAGTYCPHTRVSTHTCFEGREGLTLGDHVFIGHFNRIDGSNGLVIEEGCQITNYASILTHSSHRSVRAMGRRYVNEAKPHGYVRRATRIGAYSFIGPHSVIAPGAQIGKGVIVQGATALYRARCLTSPLSAPRCPASGGDHG